MAQRPGRRWEQQSHARARSVQVKASASGAGPGGDVGGSGTPASLAEDEPTFASTITWEAATNGSDSADGLSMPLHERMGDWVGIVQAVMWTIFSFAMLPLIVSTAVLLGGFLCYVGEEDSKQTTSGEQARERVKHERPRCAALWRCRSRLRSMCVRFGRKLLVFALLEFYIFVAASLLATPWLYVLCGYVTWRLALCSTLCWFLAAALPVPPRTHHILLPPYSFHFPLLTIECS
jgi:hypothetical protein